MMNIIEKTEHVKYFDPSLRYNEFLEAVIKELQENPSRTAKHLGLDKEAELFSRIKTADDVIGNAELVLMKFKGISPIENGRQYYQPFFATVVMAIYLYYIYEDKSCQYDSLMHARQETLETGLRLKLGYENVLKHIYETCEAALGTKGPDNLKARPDTPAEVFIIAKLIHDNKEQFN